MKTLKNSFKSLLKPNFRFFGAKYKFANKYNFSFEKVEEIMTYCNLELRVADNLMRVRTCPLCPNEHHEEPTNLYTMVIFRDSNVFQCFRCGSKGHVQRIIKKLRKEHNLSKFNLDLTTTTDIEDGGFERNQFSGENALESNENRIKVEMSNEFTLTEMYKRTYLLETERCKIVKDYCERQRGISLETLRFYQCGASFEKFRNNSANYLNLPSISYPMFYPIDKNSFIQTEREKVGEELYSLFKCDSFYLAKLKVRAIGKEFKHFQKIEPAGSLVWGLFGLNTVPKGAKEIVFTEGEYDAMVVYQV